MVARTGVEEIGRVAMVQAQQPWRKLIGTRAWLIVSESGQLHVEEIEKHSIMGWTGLPARNLLVLDLVLSYPFSILGREQATLPFEFRALESCLESACRLDELLPKISTLNLDRVRQIKSHLVAISGRVQKVRDELEHLLDDDNDMAEMYLTEKLLTHSLDNASIREEVDNAAPEIDDERAEDYNEEDELDTVVLTSYKPNIEELEMLLEAYFVQIYCTLQKLSDVCIYVLSLHALLNSVVYLYQLTSMI
ncbi:hypothetical protein EUGRSUZ_I00046 [Eucalyptus grandis]|uniref:Uncharacterized protein n=1 Tax=Eucalyptus grandis TaxID=71139 RepID=A0ACC3JC70_EUCGR|nr:hypothetical protein EUGRSUZ_I00046 [Eucalyptus grandis]